MTRQEIQILAKSLSIICKARSIECAFSYAKNTRE